MNYEKIYNNIIEKARNRKLDENVYVERHHIEPKSLGGSDDSSNIVALTAKEHYICHHLLYKYKKGNDKFKMAHAWFRMCHKSSSQQRFITSRQYEKAKIAHSQAVSKQMKGRKLLEDELNRLREKNPNRRECIINNISFGSVKQAADYFNTNPRRVRQFERNELPLEWLIDEEFRKEYNKNVKSESLKNRKLSTKNKTYEEIYGKEKALQLLEKRRLTKTGKALSEETRQKISKSTKGRKPWNKGINLNEEQKANISKSRRGKSHNRLKYTVTKPNGETIHIDENIGLRQWLRNEFNTYVGTSIKNSLKNNEPVKKGKWKGWKFNAMPRV